jgi:hypothetical protein
VRVGAPDRALKTQERQGLREAEQVGEMLVGALLPAACPDELEDAREGKQVCGGAGRKEVRYAFNRMEGPLRAGVRAGPEQRDHAVDVDHQQRPALRWEGPLRARRGALHEAFITCDGLFSLHTG